MRINFFPRQRAAERSPHSYKEWEKALNAEGGVGVEWEPWVGVSPPWAQVPGCLALGSLRWLTLWLWFLSSSLWKSS